MSAVAAVGKKIILTKISNIQLMMRPKSLGRFVKKKYVNGYKATHYLKNLIFMYNVVIL